MKSGNRNEILGMLRMSVCHTRMKALVYHEYRARDDRAKKSHVWVFDELTYFSKIYD